MIANVWCNESKVYVVYYLATSKSMIYKIFFNIIISIVVGRTYIFAT